MPSSPCSSNNSWCRKAEAGPFEFPVTRKRDSHLGLAFIPSHPRRKATGSLLHAQVQGCVWFSRDPPRFAPPGPLTLAGASSRVQSPPDLQEVSPLACCGTASFGLVARSGLAAGQTTTCCMQGQPLMGVPHCKWMFWWEKMAPSPQAQQFSLQPKQRAQHRWERVGAEFPWGSSFSDGSQIALGSDILPRGLRIRKP